LNRGRAILLGLLILCFFIEAAAADASSGGVSASINLGFDSFTEKYSIVEEDTVDNTVEFRTRFNLDFIRGNVLDSHLGIRGFVTAGNNSFDESINLDLEHVNEKTRFGLECYFKNKNFQENTTYSYANNYSRYLAKVFSHVDMGSGMIFRIYNSFEGMDFKKRTEFDYDYLRNTVSTGLAYNSSLSTAISLILNGTVKYIPDSTSINYKSFSGTVEFRRQFGIDKSIYVSLNTERRLYTDKNLRSPYWFALSNVSAQGLFAGRFGVEAENTLESYSYDISSDIYFNYIENKSAILLVYMPSFSFKAGCGPMYSFLRSNSSIEDRYDEIGIKLSLEYLHPGRIWLSSFYELGKRYYDYYGINPEAAVFSDYIFNRFSTFASFRINNHIGLNAFVSHEPLNHKRAGDDTSTTLFSLDMSYSF